jgi:hypothetical protein
MPNRFRLGFFDSTSSNALVNSWRKNRAISIMQQVNNKGFTADAYSQSQYSVKTVNNRVLRANLEE